MGRWNRTCHSFKRVRDMLSENIETTNHCAKIMYVLESCCDELTPNDEMDWDFYGDFRDLKCEIHEEIEFMMDENDYEYCEQIVNRYIDDLYDLCDSARVWLGI